MPHTNMPANTPAWLSLLNALHRDWREGEILKGNDPDPLIEKHLRETGVWPRQAAPLHQ